MKGKSILLQSSGMSQPHSSGISDTSWAERETESTFADATTTKTKSYYDPRGAASAGKERPHSIEYGSEPMMGAPTTTTVLYGEAGGNYCVGWLLVISGPMAGNSHTLRVGRNSVGRSSSNIVCLMSDEAVSREAQVYVIYDAENNEYAITPGGGSAISRLNGQRLDTSASLHHGDVITLSKKTSLRFIPACDDLFHWDSAE